MQSSGGTIAQQRLAYQHMFGACLAIGLLDDEKYVAIHCETLDDLLLEQSDHKLICFQVTTKQIGLQPFKAREAKVLQTVSNFCKLEADFGSDIVGYRFLASCGFLSEGPGEQILIRIVEKMRILPYDHYELDGIVGKFFGKLREICIPEALEKLGDVSGKLELLDHPSLPGMHDHLYHAVADALSEHDPSPACIERIMRRLNARVEQAASQRFENGNMTYTAATLGKVAFDERMQILKRISKIEIRELVDEELARQFGEIPSSPHLVDDAFPKLRGKVTLNGGTESSIKALQYNAYHALHEARARQVSQGKTQAELFDARIRAAALRLYTQIYDAIESEGVVRAPQLYREIDSQVRVFLTERRAEFPMMGEEEFIGVIALMTQQCICWWGPRRDLEALA